MCPACTYFLKSPQIILKDVKFQIVRLNVHSTISQLMYYLYNSQYIIYFFSKGPTLSFMDSRFPIFYFTYLHFTLASCQLLRQLVLFLAHKFKFLMQALFFPNCVTRKFELMTTQLQQYPKFCSPNALPLPLRWVRCPSTECTHHH